MASPGPGAARLVYATCTVTRSENRDVIAAFLRDTPDAHSLAGAGPGKAGRISAKRTISGSRLFRERRVLTASIMLP